MSRIGKKIIKVPEKTEINISGDMVVVKGPLGEISREFGNGVVVTVSEGNAVLSLGKENKNKALWGTFASHLTNMIAGVNKAFEKKLIIEGIGYKAELKGTDLVMSLGFSHPVKVPVPSDLKVVLEKGNIIVSGIDKEKVGQYVAKIRALKKPEPYKGKGIRYSDEVIRRKQGKKAA
jgi:large subunit ribosomal protein L6